MFAALTCLICVIPPSIVIVASGVVMLDAEANEKQRAALEAARAAAAAERAGGGQQEQQRAAAGGDPVFTCFVDTPGGGTVIDGAPGDFRCTVRPARAHMRVCLLRCSS
jgi:hypothetical protein